MEGNLVADEDIDGVTLDAVLLLLLLVGAEVEARGPTPLPGRVGVGRRLDIEGPGQLPISPRLLQGHASRHQVAGLLIFLDGGIRGERGSFQQKVAQPQQPEEAARFGQHRQFSGDTEPHGGRIGGFAGTG